MTASFTQLLRSQTSKSSMILSHILSNSISKSYAFHLQNVYQIWSLFIPSSATTLLQTINSPSFTASTSASALCSPQGSQSEVPKCCNMTPCLPPPFRILHWLSLSQENKSNLLTFSAYLVLAGLSNCLSFTLPSFIYYNLYNHSGLFSVPLTYHVHSHPLLFYPLSEIISQTSTRPIPSLH